MLWDLASLGAGQVLSVVLGFAGFAYLARTLSPEAYGVIEYAVGLAGLVYRRAGNARVRRTTTRTDLATYFLLTVLIGLGCYMTFADNLLTSDPYNSRASISPWWRSLFVLDPKVGVAENADFFYQAMMACAW